MRRARWILVAGMLALTLALLVPLAAVGARRAAPVPGWIDPTATLVNPRFIRVGDWAYVGPFATLNAGNGPTRGITIGSRADVQDNVLIDARRGAVRLGAEAILAHGSTVLSNSQIGTQGVCPGGGSVCPSFVSFNAQVDGAIVEKDAMVGILARVGTGVRIPSGRKVLPGKYVASQREVATETALVTEADREFMRGVIAVNTEFAKGYADLEAANASWVHGANFDPGGTEFNPNRDLPSINAAAWQDAEYLNRVIGDVDLHSDDGVAGLHLGRMVSIRADEGEPFHLGTIAEAEDRVTFHALEHTHLDLGDDGHYGYHSVVHGGPTPFDNATISGDNLRLGDWAVLFRSRVGDNVSIGVKSLVQQSDLADSTVVPARTIVISDVVVGTVEW